MRELIKNMKRPIYYTELFILFGALLFLVGFFHIGKQLIDSIYTTGFAAGVEKERLDYNYTYLKFSTTTTEMMLSESEGKIVCAQRASQNDLWSTVPCK